MQVAQKTPTSFLFPVNIGGKRTFIYHSLSACFPYGQFMKSIDRWLAIEREESKGDPFPMEGIGCWNPVFPARADDIWISSSIAVRYINEIYEKPLESQLAVFERSRDTAGFAGFRKIIE